MCDGPDLFLCVLSILFPPLGVWVKRGICSADSLINIALCCLGYLPGLIHAWYIISTYPHVGYDQIDGSDGHMQIYYVSGGPPPPSAGPPPGGHTTPQGGYGTIGGGSGGGSAAVSAQPAAQAPPQASPQPKPQQQQQRAGPSQPPAEQPAPAGPAGADIRKPPEGTGVGLSEDAAPPSYADALRGDNKIQSHE